MNNFITNLNLKDPNLTFFEKVERMTKKDILKTRKVRWQALRNRHKKLIARTHVDEYRQANNRHLW